MRKMYRLHIRTDVNIFILFIFPIRYLLKVIIYFIICLFIINVSNSLYAILIVTIGQMRKMYRMPISTYVNIFILIIFPISYLIRVIFKFLFLLFTILIISD